MSTRLAELRTRRALLQERAAQERDEVARLVHASSPPLRIADWGLRALRLIRSNPVLVGGVLGAAAILQPGRALTWSLRGWTIWQAWRRFRGGRDRTT